ncbi:MAG: DUF4139 domain-containing protein, partial [Thermoplasmata archaeon]|nr:DUF4139 domain-containing protein [Thermoplasmata archaeon]
MTRHPFGPTRGPRSIVLPALFALLLLAGVLPVATASPSHHAASPVPYQPLTGGLTGPSNLGTGLKGTYEVTATGGPALAPNGTQTGIYSYHASLAGSDLSNTTAIAPSAGVLVNGSVNLTLIAPNTTQSLTIFVLVTSSLGGSNVSQNFSEVVNIVVPYRLTATLVAGAGASIAPFNLTVLLDGSPVGTVPVSLIAPGASFPVSFA